MIQSPENAKAFQRFFIEGIKPRLLEEIALEMEIPKKKGDPIISEDYFVSYTHLPSDDHLGDLSLLENTFYFHPSKILKDHIYDIISISHLSANILATSQYDINNGVHLRKADSSHLFNKEKTRYGKPHPARTHLRY